MCYTGHTECKNKSGFSPLTDNIDKIALLISELINKKQYLQKLVSLYIKAGHCSRWPRGVYPKITKLHLSGSS